MGLKNIFRISVFLLLVISIINISSVVFVTAQGYDGSWINFTGNYTEPPSCGDGYCDTSVEFCGNCETDCGVCPAQAPSCTLVGDSCASGTDCCSGVCKQDYEGSNKYCVVDESDCAHQGYYYPNSNTGSSCYNAGSGGSPGETMNCNNGVWVSQTCSYTGEICTDECNLQKEANSCSDAVAPNSATCNTGGAGTTSVEAVDQDYCSGSQFYTCDDLNYASCVAGSYLTDPDDNNLVCECFTPGIQGDCDTNNEVGCWADSNCCGDDGVADNFIGTSGFCENGIWKIGEIPNPPNKLYQSPGSEGATTNSKFPSFNFNISTNNTNVNIGFKIQIDNDPYFSSPTIDYSEMKTGNGPYNITYKVPPYWELGDNFYYWRVKTKDSNGLESPWVEFGVPTVMDFQVVNIPTNITHDPLNFSGCWGANICGVNFTCGVYDSVCVDDFIASGAQATCTKNFGNDDYNYFKCLDPDCNRNTCFNGTVKTTNPNDGGIANAVITYEHDVWNGTNKITLKNTTTTDSNGFYSIGVRPGNGIFIMADAQGYAPNIAGPFYNIQTGCYPLNFTLANGTCESDCTKMGSNYCSASCQLEGTSSGICQYNETTSFLTQTGITINITSPYQACTNLGVQDGSYATIGSYYNSIDNIDMCVKVECCEGTPYEVPCPSTNINSSVGITDAIKITRIARNKGETMRVRVYYWD